MCKFRLEVHPESSRCIYLSAWQIAASPPPAAKQCAANVLAAQADVISARLRGNGCDATVERPVKLVMALPRTLFAEINADDYSRLY